MKYIKVFLIIFFISGCSSINNPSVLKDNIENDLDSVRTEKSKINETPLVTEFNQLYVRHLTKEEAKMPPWIKYKVSKHFKEHKFIDVVNQSFEGIKVNFEFREGVDLNKPLSIQVDGTYEDVLNTLKSTTGYNFEYTNDTLVFSKYAVEIFKIGQLSGKVNYSVGKKGISSDAGNSSYSGTQNNSGGSSFSSSSEEYSVLTDNIDVLEDIKKAVDTILGCRNKERRNVSLSIVSENKNIEDGNTSNIQSNLYKGKKDDDCDEGASSEILRSSTSILVKGLPSQIETVSNFIALKNRELTSQVKIDISLINVEFNDNTQFSLDFDLIDKTLKSFGSASLVTNSSKGLIGGLDPRGIFTLEYNRPTEDPSKLFIEALSKQGAVSEKRYPRVVVINNRVGTVANIDRVNFVEDRPLSTTANVGTNVGIKQGKVETGYTLHALPNIIGDTIVMHLSTSLSALLDLEKKGTKDVEVESPRTNDKMFNTTIKLENKIPLIIAGLSDNSNQYQNSKSSGGLGLSRSSKKKNVETFLMIKATIQ